MNDKKGLCLTKVTQNWFHKCYSRLVSQVLLKIVSFKTGYTCLWLFLSTKILKTALHCTIKTKMCWKNAGKIKQKYWLNSLTFSLQTFEVVKW